LAAGRRLPATVAALYQKLTEYASCLDYNQLCGADRQINPEQTFDSLPAPCYTAVIQQSSRAMQAQAHRCVVRNVGETGSKPVLCRNCHHGTLTCHIGLSM
jgi:hypothetical protein